MRALGEARVGGVIDPYQGKLVADMALVAFQPHGIPGILIRDCEHLD